MKPQIKVLSGSRAGNVVVFTGDEVAIGRHPSNNLQFDPERDLDVSSKHAVLVRRGDRWYVRDLGSRNGTLLNGHRVKAEMPLGNMDQIRLGPNGPHMEFKLVPESTPSSVMSPNKSVGTMQETLPPEGIRPTPQRVTGASRLSGSQTAPSHSAATPRPTGGSTTQRIRVEVGRQTRVLRNTTIGLIGTVVLVVAAFVFQNQRQQQARTQEIAEMQARADSIMRVSRAMSDSLQGQVQGLADRLRESQASLQQLQERLAAAEQSGSESEIADLRQRLADAGLAMTNQQTAARLNYRQIAAANGNAIGIVYVQFENGEQFTGTAFAVDSQGTMITNRHVIYGQNRNQRPRRIGVKLADRTQIVAADTLGFSTEADLAVIRLRLLSPSPKIQALNTRPDTLAQGDPVVVIGFPLGIELPGMADIARTSLTPGTVSKVIPDSLIQIDGYGAQGASGSPIFDANGEVIGVLFGGQPGTGGRIVYAVPATFVLRLLATIK